MAIAMSAAVIALLSTTVKAGGGYAEASAGSYDGGYSGGSGEGYQGYDSDEEGECESKR